MQASTSGGRVPARGGHTCVVADFQLVIFGGTYYKRNVRGPRIHLANRRNDDAVCNRLAMVRAECTPRTLSLILIAWAL